MVSRCQSSRVLLKKIIFKEHCCHRSFLCSKHGRNALAAKAYRAPNTFWLSLAKQHGNVAIGRGSREGVDELALSGAVYEALIGSIGSLLSSLSASNSASLSHAEWRKTMQDRGCESLFVVRLHICVLDPLSDESF
jgi:hypothetical protein